MLTNPPNPLPNASIHLTVRRVATTIVWKMPPDIYDFDELAEPTPLRSKIANSKKRRRDNDNHGDHDELSSAPLPTEQYVPRPSRSRATNNSQSADLLLIPEDYSKRPEALARKGRRVENKRRKVTDTERVEIGSGDDDDDDEEGDDRGCTIKVRERMRKEELQGEGEATPVTVTQRSDTTKSSTGRSTGSSRGGDLKSSDVSGELKRAGERLFNGQGEGDGVNEEVGEMGQVLAGGVTGKESGMLKEKRKRRNVIANSDEEEEEEEDDEPDGDIEGESNLNDGNDDNEDDDQVKAEDFDFDDPPPIKPTPKPDKPNKRTKQELEDEEEVYDEEDTSDFDDSKTRSKSKKKKGRPKKEASSSTTLDIAGTTPHARDGAVETTKKSRGRPKKKADEPPEAAAAPRAPKEHVPTPAPPTSANSPRIEDPPSDTLTADPQYPPPTSPPPPSLQQQNVPRTTTPSTKLEINTNVVTDRQSSPMTSINNANGRSSGLPGYRIGLSKAARIPSLLRVVRK